MPSHCSHRLSASELFKMPLGCALTKAAIVATTYYVARTIFSLVKKVKTNKTRAKFIAQQKPGVVYLFSMARLPGTIHMSSPTAKLETFLRIAKIPYVFVPMPGTDISPTEKFPCVLVDGEFCAETCIIIDKIAQKFKVPKEITSVNAEGLMTMRLVEGFYRFAAYRHMMVDNTDKLVPHMAKAFGAPEFLIRIVIKGYRKNVINMLDSEGHGYLPDDVYHEEWAKDIAAIESVLGTKQFFGGDSPNVVDAVVFAAAQHARFVNQVCPTKNLDRVAVSGPLAKYMERMIAKCFPDASTLSYSKTEPQEFLK